MKRLLFIIALLIFCGIGAVSYYYFYRVTKPQRIAIQCLGKYNADRLNQVKEAIIQYYGVEVEVYEPKPMPKEFFVNIKSPRYRADSIIKHLKSIKPDSVDLILAYTSHDISSTKRGPLGQVKEPKSKYLDWGIFGLGYRPGPSCVISDFRLNGKNETQTILRLKKVALHEIGHNLGLSHCENDQSCFMRSAAEKISTIDAVNLNLCDVCRKRVFN